MKTFKQFLNEVVRDEKRSINFIRGYGKRYDHGKDHQGQPIMKAPFKQWDDDVKDEDGLNNKMLTTPSRFVTKTVPVSSLRATQPSVERRIVMGKRMLPTVDSEGNSEHPAVVHHEGKHYILDGHHEAAARKVAGQTHIKVRLGIHDE